MRGTHQGCAGQPHGAVVVCGGRISFGTRVAVRSAHTFRAHACCVPGARACRKHAFSCMPKGGATSCCAWGLRAESARALERACSARGSVRLPRLRAEATCPRLVTQKRCDFCDLNRCDCLRLRCVSGKTRCDCPRRVSCERLRFYLRHCSDSGAVMLQLCCDRCDYGLEAD